MNIESAQKTATLESIAESVSALATCINDLPTRKELNGMEQRLEKQIDDLAISTGNEFARVHKKFEEVITNVDNLAIAVKNEFDRVHVRLDDMDKHLVKNYVHRKEYVVLDKLVHKLEKVAFA